MSDPLSISASVISIISFGIQVTQGLVQYYSAYHGLNDSIDSMTNTLNEQEKNLKFLKALLDRHKYPKDAAKRIEETIAALKKPYQELDAKLQKFRIPSAPMGIWESFKIHLRRPTYPLQESTMKDIRSTISESQQNLLIALNLCQMESTGAIDEKVVKVAEGVDTVKSTTGGTAEDVKAVAVQVQEVRKAVYVFEEELLNNKYITWLKPQDPSGAYADGLDKKTEGTGRWFLENAVFSKWKTSPNSLLWLHGIPGSGKTVLSSTIISELEDSLAEGQFLAFFYFDWQLPGMTHVDNLLRSLIGQIYASSKAPEALQELEKAWKDHGDGRRQPTILKLTQLLITMFSKIPAACYVVIDALDECGERVKLLKLLESISESKVTNLHLLVVSREEADIEEVLTGMVAASVGMEKTLVDADIRDYIIHELDSDSTLKKRSNDLKSLAVDRLMADVKGMFRLAELQLAILRDCGSKKEFEQALGTMPNTLDGVYERILVGDPNRVSSTIPKHVRAKTRTLLMWLCFSNRPLKLQEIQEIFAIDLDATVKFDISGRTFDREQALKPLRSLVTMHKGIYSDGSSPGRQLCEFAVLSHFSIKEYLMSDRICESTAAMYHLSLETSHAALASTCLAYLLHFDKPDSLQEDTLRQYPLLKYSSQYWIAHIKAAESILDNADGNLTWNLATELLQSKDAYENSIRVHDPDHVGTYTADPAGMGESDLKRPSSMIARPVYTASLSGWLRAVKYLLENGADINSQGGWRGTPLGAAASLGNKEMVEYLIFHGADVNESGTSYQGPPLELATQKNHVEVLEIILRNGANINARCAQFPDYAVGTTALYTAVSERNPNLVLYLLKRGADPDIICQEAFSEKETALEKAVRSGRKEIAEILRHHAAELPQSVLDADLIEACQKSAVKDEITHLLDHKAAITEDTFIAAANGTSPNKSWIIQELASKSGGIPELNRVLQKLEPHGFTTAAIAGILIASHMKAGHKFEADTETLASAARSHDPRMVELLLDLSTKTSLVAAKELVSGAGANVLHGLEIIKLLDRHFHGRLQISERAVQYAAVNPFGPAILECLSKIRPRPYEPSMPRMRSARGVGEAKLHIPSTKVPVFKACKSLAGLQLPDFMQYPLQEIFSVTPVVLATAARYGPLVNMIWLLKHSKETDIPELALVKAALSSTDGMVLLLLAVTDHLSPTEKDFHVPDLIQSTLDEFASHDPPQTFQMTISEASLAAATQNHGLGEEIVKLLLNHVQPKIEPTSRSLIAAISSYNLYKKSFKPASLKSIVQQLLRATGGSISVPADVNMRKMVGEEYEETEPEHRPLREVFLVRYAGKTVKEEEVEELLQYLEESQREIGDEDVMVISPVAQPSPEESTS